MVYSSQCPLFYLDHGNKTSKFDNVQPPDLPHLIILHVFSSSLNV